MSDMTTVKTSHRTVFGVQWDDQDQVDVVPGRDEAEDFVKAFEGATAVAHEVTTIATPWRPVDEAPRGPARFQSHDVETALLRVLATGYASGIVTGIERAHLQLSGLGSPFDVESADAMAKQIVTIALEDPIIRTELLNAALTAYTANYTEEDGIPRQLPLPPAPRRQEG